MLLSAYSVLIVLMTTSHCKCLTLTVTYAGSVPNLDKGTGTLEQRQSVSPVGLSEPTGLTPEHGVPPCSFLFSSALLPSPVPNPWSKFTVRRAAWRCLSSAHPSWECPCQGVCQVSPGRAASSSGGAVHTRMTLSGPRVVRDRPLRHRLKIQGP